MSNLKSLIERRLSPVGKSGKDIIYMCPYCGEQSGHLWVNYDTNKFHCFKCDVGGKSLLPLLNKLGIDIRFDYDSLELDYSKSLEDIILDINKSPKRKLEDFSKNLKVVTSYFIHHSQPLSDQAREYLHNRGFSDNLINSLCICEGVDRRGNDLRIGSLSYTGRDYSGRILVPSLRRDGLVSFYVARDYTNTKKNKYLNPPKDLAYASEDVWSLDIIDSDHVIICEGVFTAISVNNALGKNVAVATYGKSISSTSNSENTHIEVTSQGEKLLRRGFSLYIVFYDKDAIDSAIDTCRYLYDRGAFVRLVKIPRDMYGPKADANDMTKEEIIKCIQDSVVFDRFTGIFDINT